MSSPPGEEGVIPLALRLRLGRPATFWNRSRFAYSAIAGEVATVRMFCRHRSEWTRLIIRSFREWHIPNANRDPLAFVAEPAKPEAQGERTRFAPARSDDKSSRSQTARDKVACGKTIRVCPQPCSRPRIDTNFTNRNQIRAIREDSWTTFSGDTSLALSSSTNGHEFHEWELDSCDS